MRKLSLFSRALRRYGRKNAEVNASISSMLQELLSGIRVIKAFATEKEETDRFNKENAKIIRINFRQSCVSELSSPVMEFIGALGIGLVIWYGGREVVQGNMTPGTFFAFMGALAMLYSPFKTLNGANMNVQNALAGAERVFAILDDPALKTEKGGGLDVNEPFRELAFRNVTLRYGDESVPALRGITLTVRSGERIAFVGPSGAGKTTLVNLIPRFYVPQEGEITLNGRPLGDYSLASLRRSVAMVSQDAFLFDTTIAENIAYGRDPALPLDMERVRRAAAAAYAAVAGLPCVIFTTSNVSPSMKTLMQAYGASVFVTPSMADRGVIMEKLVRELDFVPASGVMSPPIGSSCFGIDAYKSIAFEVFEQMGGQVPDWFVVPISYGDTLYGIYKGMCDLKEMGYIEKVPKFAAAEVFHAVENTIKAGSSDPIPQPSEPSIQTSIATGFCAYHTVQAVKDSGGAARSSHDPEALKMQQRLAKTEGVFGESASVASLVVLEKLLKEGVVRPDEKVVVLMTSTGVKTPEVTDMWVPEIPCIQPTLADFRNAMESSYGIKI